MLEGVRSLLLSNGFMTAVWAFLAVMEFHQAYRVKQFENRLAKIDPDYFPQKQQRHPFLVGVVASVMALSYFVRLLK